MSTSREDLKQRLILEWNEAVDSLSKCNIRYTAFSEGKEGYLSLDYPGLYPFTVISLRQTPEQRTHKICSLAAMHTPEEVLIHESELKLPIKELEALLLLTNRI